jgi:hypothetical protein
MIYRQSIDDHRMEGALSLTSRSDKQLLAETSENGHLLFHVPTRWRFKQSENGVASSSLVSLAPVCFFVMAPTLRLNMF